jgi:hypothetical protein
MGPGQAAEGRFALYKANAQDPNTVMGAGLDITVHASQLPAIIKVLKGLATKK